MVNVCRASSVSAFVINLVLLQFHRPRFGLIIYFIIRKDSHGCDEIGHQCQGQYYIQYYIITEDVVKITFYTFDDSEIY